jgi:hypothetical protein
MDFIASGMIEMIDGVSGDLELVARRRFLGPIPSDLCRR